MVKTNLFLSRAWSLPESSQTGMPAVTTLSFSFGNKSSFPVFQASLSNHVLGTVLDHGSEILTCLKNIVDGFLRNANLVLKTMFDLKQ